MREFSKKCLDLNVREVFSANAIFRRTPNCRHLESGLDPVCWQIHQLLFSKIKPKYIICLGNGRDSSFHKLKQRLAFDTDDERRFKKPNGKNFYIRWFDKDMIRNNVLALSSLIRVIGVPHPSWFPLGAEWFSKAWKELGLVKT